MDKYLLEGNCAEGLGWEMTALEEHVEEGEEGKCCFQERKPTVLEPGRAVTQARDGEEAGIAAQHQKQTEFLFLAGLGRAHKGPCCELNAACSWQALSAALQLGLCLSASASSRSLHFPGNLHFCFYSPISPGEESGPAAERDQSQLWAGVL